MIKTVADPQIGLPRSFCVDGHLDMIKATARSIGIAQPEIWLNLALLIHGFFIGPPFHNDILT
jgi:hypothetical protein